MMPAPACPQCGKVMDGGLVTYEGDLMVGQSFNWFCRNCQLQGRVMDAVYDRRHKVGSQENLEGKDYQLTSKQKEGTYVFLFYKALP